MAVSGTVFAITNFAHPAAVGALFFFPPAATRETLQLAHWLFLFLVSAQTTTNPSFTISSLYEFCTKQKTTSQHTKACAVLLESPSKLTRSVHSLSNIDPADSSHLLDRCVNILDRTPRHLTFFVSTSVHFHPFPVQSLVCFNSNSRSRVRRT